MKCLPVFNVSSYNFNNASVKNRQQYNKSLLSQPSFDTISFGISATKYAKPAVTPMRDAIEKKVSSDIEHRFRRLSQVFLDVTNSIAEELAPIGISFNKKYAAKNPVKSAASSAEKMSRYGSLTLPDQIRTTLFSSKFYDLSVLFDKIIPAYASRGYILDPKSPDIEICMEDISSKVKDIPEEYKSCACPPRASGIEQIQLRFIRESDLSDNPVKHELIIIPGYEYAKAKHYESSNVYSHTRKLNELTFIKKGSQVDRNVILALRYTSLIKAFLNSEISKVLFENAKNQDLYGIPQNIPITITDNKKMFVKNYFLSLEKCLKDYYKAAVKRAKTQQRLDELDKFIEHDLEMLNSIRDAILGNPRKKIEGTLDFFAKSKHKKDPFK